MRDIAKIAVFAVIPFAMCCPVLASDNPMKENSAMAVEEVSLETFNTPDIMMREQSRFDADFFEKHKGEEENDTCSYVRGDGVTVTLQGLSNNEFSQRLTRSDSPFKYTSIFDKNYLLTGKIVRFYGAPVDTALEYDKSGKIQAKEDMYMGHKIKVNDLREVFMKELDRDIYDPKQVFSFTLSSYGEPTKPYYKIALYLPPLPSYKLEHFLVDGITGEILYRILGWVEEGTYMGDDPDEQDVYIQYQKHLKEVEQQGKKDD